MVQEYEQPTGRNFMEYHVPHKLFSILDTLTSGELPLYPEELVFLRSTAHEFVEREEGHTTQIEMRKDGAGTYIIDHVLLFR
jgi:hypothetical protein